MDLLSASRNRGAVAKARKTGSSIVVEYSDGWKERIVSGRYMLFDPGNRLVVKRAAKKSDRLRLNSVSKIKR